MTLFQNVTLTVDVNLIVSWRENRLLALPAPEEAPTAIRATETDMVELALALHAAGVFPNATQEAVIDKMRQLSGLPLQSWQQLGANIRRRDSLKFLDRLQNSLGERNEEIKENGRANRRPKFPQK